MIKKFDQKTLADMAAKAALKPSNRMMQQGQPSIPLDIVNKGDDMTCQNEIPVLDNNGNPIEGQTQLCNNPIFVEGRKLKYVSPILSPTGTNTICTLLIGNMCARCGAIFNPDQWLQKRLKEGGNKDANSKL